MPKADVQVNVKLTTEKRGFDVFEITARHILPNRDYTVFLDEDAGFPFGAAEYIGEFSANAQGNAHAEYHLIVQEAFASTIVVGSAPEATISTKTSLASRPETVPSAIKSTSAPSFSAETGDCSMPTPFR